MRILHLAQNTHGGVASYLNEIAAAQSERYGSKNVAFAIPAAHADQLALVPQEQRALLPDPGRSASALLRMEKGMRNVIRNWAPDLLHIHSTFAGVLVRWPYLLRKRRPSVVYCAHGWSFLMDVGAARRHAYMAIERTLARATDRVINISLFEHRAAIAAGLPIDKLRHIDNGIAAYAPDELSAIEMTPPETADHLNLLFVGRHDRQKGLDILLTLMDRLANRPVHLHVVGGAVLTNEPTPTEHRPNVSFYGWRSRGEVASLMHAADVVVVPSRWEGFGLVAAEAMCAGRAVLASDRGALPEVVEDHVTGRIFPLDDPTVLIDIIENTPRAAWATMGAAGRRRYQARYTAERMNEALFAVYDELSDSAPR